MKGEGRGGEGRDPGFRGNKPRKIIGDELFEGAMRCSRHISRASMHTEGVASRSGFQRARIDAKLLIVNK